MTRHATAAAVAAIVLLVGCGDPPRRKERGFDSEEECYRNHGYTGGSISTEHFRKFDYWCG